MSAKMNLVWLPLSKALEKSIAMVVERCQCVVWRTGLVETPGYSMFEGDEGWNGGVVGTEDMLDW